MAVIVGIDEVGRGPLAGPLVAAAVALTDDKLPFEVRDSKLLSIAQREELVPQIQRHALSVGLGWVDHVTIDRYGLTLATRKAMSQAVRALKLPYDQAILDGSYNYLRRIARCEAIVKADNIYPCVSAASIIAKVARDNYMRAISKLYPDYGFEKHVGYSTKAHITQLLSRGPSPMHRMSFRPLRAYREG